MLRLAYPIVGTLARAPEPYNLVVVTVLFKMTSESRMLTQAQNQRPTHPN
jgi:hypothetical protein